MGSFEEQIEKRIDKIEQILDRLTDTVVALAKAEEKLKALEANRVDIFLKIEKMDSYMNDIKTTVDKTNSKVIILSRFVVATLTGIGIAIFTYILSLL